MSVAYLLSDSLAHLLSLFLELSMLFLSHLLSLLQGEEPFALLLLHLGSLLSGWSFSATNIGYGNEGWVRLA